MEVSFNVRGNEYKGRYFVNLQAWKISGATAKAAPTPAPKAEPELLPESEDDVPF